MPCVNENKYNDACKELKKMKIEAILKLQDHRTRLTLKEYQERRRGKRRLHKPKKKESYK